MEKLIVFIAIIITLVVVPLTGYHFINHGKESVDFTTKNLEIKVFEKIETQPKKDFVVHQKSVQKQIIAIGRTKLTTVAEFLVSGKVLAITKHGRYKDVISGKDVMPVDIGITWGEFATQLPNGIIFKHSLPTLDFTSKNKWLFWDGTTDLKTAEKLKHHVANIHIVPKDENILALIQNIQKNDLVKMGGFLVDVQIDNKLYKSSMSRSDTGAGACEILYVDFVESL